MQTSGLVYGGTNNSTLTVFISASQPALGTAEYANWLPAPNNSAMFFLLRTYEPPSYAIAGGYSPPRLCSHCTRQYCDSWQIDLPADGAAVTLHGSMYCTPARSVIIMCQGIGVDVLCVSIGTSSLVHDGVAACRNAGVCAAFGH